MRTGFALSLALHGAIVVLILSLSVGTPKTPGYPAVYRVRLVAVPPPPEPQAESTLEEEVASPEPSMPAPAEKPKPETSPPKKQPVRKRKQETPAPASPGPMTNVLSVDDAQFQESWYLTLILNRVGENWRNPARGPGKLSAVVHFVIARSGKVLSIELEESSGYALFDQAALRALYDTSHLPPLPREFGGETLGVHLEFEYVG